MKNKRFGPSVLSSLLVANVRSNPSIKAKDVMREIMESYGLDVKYHAAWCGKQIAYNEVNGDETLSFGFLLWYLDEFVCVNDGSFCALKLDNDSNRFNRLFIYFEACVKGF